jgi:polyisoprenoid-binding protein YceI
LTKEGVQPKRFAPFFVFGVSPMKKLLYALPLLVAVPLLAQMPKGPPGKADPKLVTAGTYEVEKTHAQIQWAVNHFGFNDYFGFFGNPTGSLILDPAKPNASKVSITIPISDLATSSKGLTDHMLRAGADGKGADFFNVAAHPNATFKSTSVVATGSTAKIMGDLTLNGVSKPVTLDAKFIGVGANPFRKKETVGFHATTTIKRSDWGIGYGLPLVADDVRLTISVAFEKTA